MSFFLTLMNDTIRSIDPHVANINANFTDYRPKRVAILNRINSTISRIEHAESVWKRLTNPDNGATQLAFRLNSTLQTMPPVDEVFEVANGTTNNASVDKLVLQKLVRPLCFPTSLPRFPCVNLAIHFP